uniref:Uncharacterized protein n=1 Tax=Amphilophus citrinellus TaxID=61819 RepID=A0A3Q0RGC2_AMPCI
MVIKTNILPRLLYLFLSLPIQIPDCQFREWDRAISRFIWNGKAPRIRFKTLQLPRCSGGMGLPCLKDYYIAAQIRPAILWCNNDYTAKWKAIELSQSNKPLQSLLGNPVTAKHNIQNHLIKPTINTWLDIVKKFNLQNEICVLRWPAHDLDFEQAPMDRSFIQWEKQGITMICLLIDNLELIDFKTVCERYTLNCQDFYRYLQLHHYYTKDIKGSLKGNISTLTQMFIKAYKSKLNKKIIGGLYRNINELRGHSTSYIKEKWEKELDIIITHEDWAIKIDTQNTTTNSQVWRDFSWKNSVSYFITPIQKSKQTDLPPACCWECGYSYIFWSCPVLKYFWEGIHSSVKEILGYNIEFTCLSFYLGSIDPSLSKICQLNDGLLHLHQQIFGSYSGYGKYSDHFKFFSLCFIAAIC